MSSSTAASVIASLGTAVGIATALAPIPTMRAIIAANSNGDYSVLPYIVTFCQCLLWISYASVTPGKLELLPVNIFVCVVEFVYVAIFLKYVEKIGEKQVQLFRTIGISFGPTVLILGISYFLSAVNASKVLGVSAVISNIVMYGAPLAAVRTVIETRSVRYMPFLLSFIGTIASLIWSSWAFITKDTFVLTPNLIGAVLGFIQLGVYFKYKRIEEQDLLQQRDSTPMIPQISTSTDATSHHDEESGLIKK
jgi:solute carrier family 50 protein (sugar transporter)